MRFPCCADLFNSLTMYFSIICSKCFKMSRNLKKEALASGLWKCHLVSECAGLLGNGGWTEVPSAVHLVARSGRGCWGFYELPLRTERRARHLWGSLLHLRLASGLVLARPSAGPSQRAGAQGTVPAPGPLSPHPVRVHGCTQMVPEVDTGDSPGLTGGPADSELVHTELTPVCRVEGLENGVRCERNTCFLG